MMDFLKDIAKHRSSEKNFYIVFDGTDLPNANEMFQHTVELQKQRYIKLSKCEIEESEIFESEYQITISGEFIEKGLQFIKDNNIIGSIKGYK